MPGERRQARIAAMQALCQWDVQHDVRAETLCDFFEQFGAVPAATSYATELVNGFWKNAEFVDGRIEDAVERWSFERISTVERNLMRVAVVELVGCDVPPRVILDEAIEIAQEFGGKESPRFVNGVLDRILQTLPKAEENDG
ncbi:MAG: transcription antitermination factor NusB [Planctomycetes bacterium]|nr:transcription antitermination factor NusB [Planctomycetota bacterium]